MSVDGAARSWIPRGSQQRISDPAVECLAPEARRALQARRLEALLQRARAASAFYRGKLPRAGGPRNQAAGLEAAVELPFTTRAELADDQRRCFPFGSFHAVGAAEAALLGRTGVGFSTTRRRLNVLATAEDIVRQGALFVRAFWEAGVRPGQRVYLADDPRYNLMAMYAMRGVAAMGAITVYTGAERTVRTARYIVPVLPPEHVFLTPTYARYLPGVLVDRSGRRWPIRSISGWGEPGYSVPHLRARLRALWSEVSDCAALAIVDIYGLSETGIIAFGCREGGGLHLLEDAVLVETVDPEGDAVVPPGEAGEVVVTLLESVATPLIRYRTGDVAVLDETPCPCGRTGRRLRRLQRLSDRVVVDGRSLYPLDVDEALEAAGARVDAYVIARLDPGGRCLRLRVSGLDAAGGAGQAAARLERALGVRVLLEVQPPDKLPPFLHKTMRTTDTATEAYYEEQLALQRELEHA